MTAHKILLVDDNPATRRLVRFALGERGHEVHEAADGKTARELVAAVGPDLVLLDLVLPDTDGFALVGELREAARRDTTIIAFSGFLSKVDETRLAAVGFDGVIEKPVEPDRLVALVESHLPRTISEADRFGTGRTVLVVDDDPLQLKLVRTCLGQLGFEVACAADGHEAVDLARSGTYDAIVADVMMPGLDGFEVAAAIRDLPESASMPLLLVTSSYVTETDRELARRVGANDLIVRTPDLGELILALNEALTRPTPIATTRGGRPPGAASARRVVHRLERQARLTSGLLQRCSVLSAEVAVFRRMSEAVLKNRRLDDALDDALAACLDAGGISIGALYLVEGDGRLSVRSIGSSTGWSPEALGEFFGHADVLRAAIDGVMPVEIPSAAVDEAVSSDLLGRCGACSVLVLPLAYLDTALGALVVIARRREQIQAHWHALAHTIANQLSQVLALSVAFEARTRAEQLAQERTSFLDALLEQAPDFVLYIDPGGIVRYASRVAPGHEDGVGRPVTAAVAREHLARVLATGEAASWEASERAADGEPTFYWCTMGPIRRDGVITGAVLLARDITEKKKADAQLIASDRMASVGILAAGVAHEINNPLAAVMANLEVTVMELKHQGQHLVVPPDIEDALNDARDAADRIRAIVRDLRLFSRSQEDEVTAVDVEHVLDSTLRMAWNEIRHRARVIKDYGGVPPAAANDARLGQVFLNLIVNAAHAIPEGNYEDNSIRVATSVDRKGRIVVRIADSGSGIPPEVQAKIFTPFFTTKPVGLGTGLGLSICQRIVASLGGAISFECRPGGGTEFQVTLQAAHFEETATTKMKQLSPPGRRGRVLVVDDEALVLSATKRILGVDHDVVTAKGGEAALDLVLAGERFDVILCDLMMPQVTGMELHAAIERRDPAQAERIIFLTGGAFTPGAREFLDDVSNHRVEKPFNARGLRALVSSVVG
jgi:PAS domain S-box-containing protein